MQPLDRLDGPILAYGPRDPLNQFLVVGLHQLGLAFCLLVDHDIHRNLFPCFSLAHLEDVQNQTSIFDNHSTTLCSRASIITIRQRPFFSAFADMLDFSSREEPVVREHGTCQTDNKQTIRRSEEEKTMKIKRLGRTGLKVSEICLGTMTFGNQCDEPTSRAIMDKAFDYRVTFFDTADAYPIGGALESMGRTEEYIRNWLKGRREQIVLASKFFLPMGTGPNDRGGSRKHIFQAAHASLRRLQTDYLDLYQMHFPDFETPLDETLGALDDLVHSGKVRYIGCSNYPAWLLAKVLWISDKLGLARFDCVQPRYNLLFRHIENELLPLCRHHGVGVIPYNPLAGGFLTGKYKPDAEPAPDLRFGLAGRTQMIYRKRYWQEAQFAAVAHLQEFFAARNKSLTQVAIAWVLAQPDITAPIVGATSPEQLRQSLPATELTLDAEELEVCNEVWFTIPRLSDPTVALR